MRTIKTLSIVLAITAMFVGCKHSFHKVYHPPNTEEVSVKPKKPEAKPVQIQAETTATIPAIATKQEPVKKAALPTRKISIGEKLDRANRIASQKPSNFKNAIIQYDFLDGGIYHIYTSPKKITDIRFEPGENIVDVNGADTSRWKIARTTSGSGTKRLQHLHLKPTKPKLKTNFIITTDRRTYYLNLRAFVNSYMAAVSWKYPSQEADTQTNNKDVFQNLDKVDLNFRYNMKVKGTTPWMPEMVFDDGVRTYIKFPDTIHQFDLPVLYLVSKHSSSQLVNSRYLNGYLVADKVITHARLIVGQDQVHIYNETRYKKSWWENQSTHLSEGANYDNY